MFLLDCVYIEQESSTCLGGTFVNGEKNIMGTAKYPFLWPDCFGVCVQLLAWWLESSLPHRQLPSLTQACWTRKLGGKWRRLSFYI